MCKKDSDIFYIKLLRHLATYIFYNHLLKIYACIPIAYIAKCMLHYTSKFVKSILYVCFKIKQFPD